MTPTTSFPELAAKTGRTLRDEGPFSLLRKALIFGRSETKKRYCYENRWIGRLVELLGDRVSLDGLQFDLDNPHIATELKCRFWLGTYEEGACHLIPRHLNPNLPVIEFGGGIGVIACMVNRRLSHPAAHVVIEAHPGLLSSLEKNKALNHCQFQVLHRALAYGRSRIEFWMHPTRYISSGVRAGQGSQKAVVETTTLEQVVDEYKFERFNLIVDVEGIEVELVERELDLIARRVENLIVEEHGDESWGVGAEAIRRMRDQLLGAGFVQVGACRGDRVYQNKRLIESGGY